MAKVKLTPLGSKAYAVSKSWSDKGEDVKNAGASVIPCKLVTYVNYGGKVVPQYKATNSKSVFTETSHHVYLNLEDAVEKISPAPVKKKRPKK